jgi:hypothetical protein
MMGKRRTKQYVLDYARRFESRQELRASGKEGETVYQSIKRRKITQEACAPRLGNTFKSDWSV